MGQDLRLVLGIETSCDETAVALVRADRTILSHHVYSQMKSHEVYGGVVPEVAARGHLAVLPALIQEALKEAKVSLSDLDGVAATCGPGLIGGVLVGAMMAKTIAAVHDLPFLAVNHLAAHALTVRLSYDVPYPFLVLLVSGGHCQILIVRSPSSFQLLGSTLDDAVGESFDKTAKLLGLSYPGGPAVEAKAKKGNPKAFSFPRPLMHQKGKPFSFSFSGLKTAVRTVSQAQLAGQVDPVTQASRTADICASFQEAVKDVLVSRCANAFVFCAENKIPITHFVVAGGVAANAFLRSHLKKQAESYQIPFVAPAPNLCTDNGAMVAWAGVEKLQSGLIDSLEFVPRPRWPLEELSTMI